MGANLLLMSTARGAGMAVNSDTKQETYEDGIGGRRSGHLVIFMFENDKALAKARSTR